jgi:hypothetical protein
VDAGMRRHDGKAATGASIFPSVGTTFRISGRTTRRSATTRATRQSGRTQPDGNPIGADVDAFNEARG